MNTSEVVEIEQEDENGMQDEEQQEAGNAEDGTGNDEGETAEAEGQTEEEVVVSIGDETPAEEEAESRAPEWVRELRKSHRELQRENRELKAKLSTPESTTVQVGKKPTLEDFDYDTDKFESELTAWYERKRESDSIAEKAAKEAMAQQEAWQSRLDEYAKRKGELKVKDYDDAESVAQEVFSQTQQGVILQGAENPALVVYALGKNHNKAKELSEIKDPVKFAFAIAKLETQLKVTNRKSPPAPEKTVSGTGRVSGSVDSTLDRLREDAAKTGDYTKVLQYRAQQKAKNK